MKLRREFPQHLLKRPWEERLAYFEECKIPHARMEVVAAEIKSAIRRRAGQGFIFVVGPTRIGKTTMLEHVVVGLLEESMQDMLNDPGFIPVAWMETAAYQRGYDWKDHWVGCLKALREPLIEHKSLRTRPELLLEDNARAFIRESQAGRVLRRSFEEAARHRRLRVFCIDEAHHLTLVPYSKMYRAQLEIIKSVASRSGAMHVLFGTYDLLKLRNASGQLGSRAMTIHFSRYRPDGNDPKDFAVALRTLVAHMPLHEKPDLGKDLEYCFDTCLGLIGLLKVWLMDALGAALENGQKTLSRRDLEKHEPPIDVLDKISDEIVKGERLLEQNEARRTVIRERMEKGSKFKEGETSENLPDKYEGKPEGDAPASPPAQAKAAKKGMRIERKPKRDKVGGGRKKRAA